MAHRRRALALLRRAAAPPPRRLQHALAAAEPCAPAPPAPPPPQRSRDDAALRAALRSRDPASLRSGGVGRDVDALVAAALGCEAAGGGSPEEGRALLPRVLDHLHGAEAEHAQRAAHALLVTAGVWRAHHNVSALRARLPLSFDARVLAAADALSQHPPADADAARRADLRRLDAFAVDGADTTEVDDALSAEALPAGRIRVWVHVSDAGAALGGAAEGQLVLAEAARRGATAYFPTGRVPMFPRLLGEGTMSLSTGADRCALSIGVTLNEDGDILGDAIITPSLIRVTHGITYEQADVGVAAQAHPALGLLAAAAYARRAWRLRRGAVTISLPDTKTTVVGADVTAEGAHGDAVVSCAAEWGGAHEPGAEHVAEQYQNTGRRPPIDSRSIVAECMVLAGHVAASAAASAGLRLPFRGQPASSLPPAERLDSLGPIAGAAALRSCMTSSFVSALPAAHFALGLPCYAQVTSPIRRYCDLASQAALKAWLRGERVDSSPPADGSAPGLPPDVEAASSAAARVTRAAREQERYWAAAFYAQTFVPGARHDAVLLRRRDGGPAASVLLVSTGVEAAARVTGDVAEGGALRVALSGARPRDGFLAFLQVA